MTEKKKAVETVPETIRAAENKFSKEQLLMSERFKDRRDIADAKSAVREHIDNQQLTITKNLTTAKKISKTV